MMESGSASVIIVVLLFSHVLALASTASQCYKYDGNNDDGDDNGFPPPGKTCAEVKAESEASTTTIIEGGERASPRCLENGDYDLYQCDDASEKECRCVDCAGVPIRGVDAFSRHRISGDESSSACACVRQRDAFRRTGMLGVMYRCDDHDGGRFLPYQCRGTGCHCTDPSGRWIRTDVEGAQFKIWQAEGKDEFCRQLLTSSALSSP